MGLIRYQLRREVYGSVRRAVGRKIPEISEVTPACGQIKQGVVKNVML